MLYTYPECISKYGNDYQIKKKLSEMKLFAIEKGIYSDVKYVSELEVIVKKYPDSIFTLNSAFFYHGLTDTIPSRYYLATERGKRKITDKRVKQIFENSGELELGATQMAYNNATIRIYNKERVLIELIRNKSKIPFELYKEIICNYRNVIDDLDVALISDYAYELPKTKMVMDTLRKEVL